MRDAPEPTLDDLLRTLAVARLLLGPDVNIQAPPNLTPGVYPRLLAAGLNDWGGISPLTLDHINPEKPWPRPARAARGHRGARASTSASGWRSIPSTRRAPSSSTSGCAPGWRR